MKGPFQNDLDRFAEDFEMTMEILAQKSPSLIAVIGDFKAKSTNWYNKDKKFFEGSTIDLVTSRPRLHQLINHMLKNHSSCFHLIFTCQPNLVIESGAHSFLHSSCLHQIVKFVKFNLKICYPTPYSKEDWHFKETETDLIRRALNDFNWERAFSKTNVNEKVCIFNKSALNFLSNFIPHETALYDDKAPPSFKSWINSLLQAKTKVFLTERTKLIFNCLIN